MRIEASNRSGRPDMVRRIILLVAVVVGVPGLAGAQGESVAAWTRFRSRFPYHVQTIALSQPQPGGRRVLIVSEPPPAVTLYGLRTAFGDRVSELTVQTQSIGVDGWVKDVVGTIAISDQGELSALVSDVTRHLFGTSHKAYLLEFDRPLPSSSFDFDLSVSAAELMRAVSSQRQNRSNRAAVAIGGGWAIAVIAALVFLKRRRLAALAMAVASAAGACWIGQGPAVIASETGDFVALHGGRSASLLDLINSKATGVFLSAKPGVVALIVPRHEPLNQATVALREFAVDSDLIVGAIGSSDTVAILGRERSIGVEALPPLRVETLLQLAATGKSELGQSYERNFLLAGRYRENPNRDWAPIYLSDELQDTEYGSLLNVTDQLLKSWSQHGEVHYANFHYPEPGTYPFEGPLSRVAKTREVTFNWNTKGVGYVTSAPPYEVVAFSRMGALPVDYLGDRDASLKSAEETAYEYFAKTGDPNLARVVQYAGVYQIWRHFGVPATFAPSGRKRHGADVLAPFAGFLLKWLAMVDLDDLRARASNKAAPHIDEFAGTHERLTTAISTHGPALIKELAAAIVSPRDYSTDNTEMGQTIVRLVRDLERSRIVGALLSDRLAMARALYQEGESRFDPNGWIKTPSIVESWTSGSTQAAVGGHNVDSVISSLRADASVARGQVKVIEEGGARVLLHNPEDAGKMHGVVRTFGRNQDADVSDLAGLVRAKLPSVAPQIRPIQSVLRLGVRDASQLRGMEASHANLLASRGAWKLGGGVPREHTAVLSQLSDASVVPIVIERQQGKYLISHEGRGAVIEAGDSASALDAVLAGVPAGSQKMLHVHFRGVELDQARGIARSLDLREGHAATRLRTSLDTGDPRSLQLIGELKGGRWNVAEAKVRIAEPMDGALTSKIDAEVHLPATTVGRPITVKVAFAFKNAVSRTAETFARLQAAIERWLVTLTDRVDLMLASRRLMRELRAIDPTIGHVDIRLADDTVDVTVVEHIVPTATSHGE